MLKSTDDTSCVSASLAALVVRGLGYDVHVIMPPPSGIKVPECENGKKKKKTSMRALRIAS